MAERNLRRVTVGDVAVGSGRVAHLGLLGAFRLTLGDGATSIPQSGQRLLVFLGLHGPQSRSYTAGMLFPEVTEARANARLRSTLSRANRSGGHLIEAFGGCLMLSPTVLVDAQCLADAARRTLNPASGASSSMDDVELLVGAPELLPGWYEDWVIIERDRLAQLRVRALESLTARHLASGELTAAHAAAAAAVRADSLREAPTVRSSQFTSPKTTLSPRFGSSRPYVELLERSFGQAKPSQHLLELIEAARTL